MDLSAPAVFYVYLCLSIVPAHLWQRGQACKLLQINRQENKEVIQGESHTKKENSQISFAQVHGMRPAEISR